MKAIYFDGKKAFFTEEYPKPIPMLEKGESLIRILISAVCNTDKEILKGYKPDFKGVMGHEFVGIVEDSHDKTLLGKRVVGELNDGCGHCLYCQTARQKHCPDRRCIGISKADGCFAQYMVWKNKLLHVVPDTIATEKAIFTEPLAAALEIPTQVHIKPDMPIAVIGDGRLSLMVTQVLSLSGACVTVIGKHTEKLTLFQKYAKTTVSQEGSYEIVVDATGSASGFDTAKKLVRKGGTIILKSTYAGELNVNMSHIVVNEITIVGSRCGPFAPALNLLEKGLITLPEITLYPLEQFQEAFEANVFKAGFLLSQS